MERPLIIVLNADFAYLEMIREFLNDEGYAVRLMQENNGAFETILAEQPRLVMIELLLTDPEA